MINQGWSHTQRYTYTSYTEKGRNSPQFGCAFSRKGFAPTERRGLAETPKMGENPAVESDWRPPRGPGGPNREAWIHQKGRGPPDFEVRIGRSFFMRPLASGHFGPDTRRDFISGCADTGVSVCLPRGRGTRPGVR